MPKSKISIGIRKLVGLPNKNMITPLRIAPKIPNRFFGGMLG